MQPRCCFSIALTVLLFLSVASVRAESQESAQSPSSSSLTPGARREGLYTGLTTGRLMFTGGDRQLYRDNWVVGLKMGYDILKYVGVEGVFKFSGHPSTFGSTTSTVPKAFFVYQLIGQVKGAYPITHRLHAELGLGGGLFMSSPNQNALTAANRPMFYAEMGLEYFMRTRGISIGIDPSFAGVQHLKGMVVQATGFVRYTF